MVLPAFALFPLSDLRSQLPPQEWVTCLESWLVLVDSHLSLSKAEFASISTKDETLANFLASFLREVARDGAGILGSSESAKKLLRDCFLLTAELLQSASPPPALAQWEFLADMSRTYGKKRGGSLLNQLSQPAQSILDTSMSGLKRFLVKNLEAGIREADLRAIEERLDRLGDLIHASPSVAGFFLAGSDFLDGLITCFKIMNPPLRKVLISTTYLCLMGLAEGEKMSALTDQLYSLKAAADTHKSGPLNVNDSLVAELVTATPLIQQLQRKLEESGNTSSRTRSILTELASFKKSTGSGGLPRPKRLIRRKIDKGKALDLSSPAELQQEIHIHRMSQITQVQDLFPDLGSAFISALLDEYAESTEQVIAHLLEDSLPPHLASLDRSASLTAHPPLSSHLPTHPTPPPFDDDDPLLSADLSRLQVGKRTDTSADALLARPTVSKASILAALAAFDSDDDERDDTYDAADVGGTVDTAPLGADDQPMTEGVEAALFRAWTATPAAFERTPVARRGVERARLRMETGMSDEQVEGWAVMMGRDPGMKRRLQARWGEWKGEQREVEGTAWRAGEEEEGGDGQAGGQGQRGGGGMQRGRGRGRGGRGGGPPVAADSELARRRKEANKSSRANHNRRDGRARKMARGGGLPG
ncbi:hypothetical protein B0T18DRAFT_420957 [Schizothecium vesticola]|uniref:CUE domain-containing protein n=1 Tax=Schizothecium vesticola TaxID=314040 RepID=A0AA40EE04_9PEZI|nr:hypothetical protein B0T18DRAFT_420957 [Schizothecium vesticola]